MWVCWARCERTGKHGGQPACRLTKDSRFRPLKMYAPPPYRLTCIWCRRHCTAAAYVQGHAATAETLRGGGEGLRWWFREVRPWMPGPVWQLVRAQSRAGRVARPSPVTPQWEQEGPPIAALEARISWSDICLCWCGAGRGDAPDAHPAVSKPARSDSVAGRMAAPVPSSQRTSTNNCGLSSPRIMVPLADMVSVPWEPEPGVRAATTKTWV